MVMAEQVQLKKARLVDMILYGFGGIGANIPFIFMGAYLSFFYTDIFGLAPAIVSALMLGSKIVDAVIDPFIGALADRVVTKFGKFRPFVMFGAPVMGLSIFMVFSTPDLDPNAKVLYACAAYIFYVVASSFVVIPNNSIANLMSADPKQRATVQTFKQGMAAIPQFMSAMALPLVDLLGGGTAGWSNYGIVMGIATCVVFWICTMGSKNYDTYELAREETTGDKSERKSAGDVVRDIAKTFKNKEMLLLIGAFCTEMTCFTLQNTMNMYYFTYVLGHKDWVATVSSVGVIVGIIGTITVPFFTRVWGKKRSFQVFVALTILPNLLMLFVPSPELALITVAMSSYSFTSRIVIVFAWSMIPDVVDYGEYTTGVRSNGLTQASVQLMNQLGQALGGSIPVMIIGALGYVANRAQTPEVLGAIVALRWGVPCVFNLISFIFIRFYGLTDERAAEIGAKLQERRIEARSE